MVLMLAVHQDTNIEGGDEREQKRWFYRLPYFIAEFTGQYQDKQMQEHYI